MASSHTSSLSELKKDLIYLVELAHSIAVAKGEVQWEKAQFIIILSEMMREVGHRLAGNLNISTDCKCDKRFVIMRIN